MALQPNRRYDVSAVDYLARADSQLRAGTQEGLFYAAFELRAGVEARLKEYLEVQAHVSENKKRGWRVADLGRATEAAFRTGDKIVQLSFQTADEEAQIDTYYYTPVTRALRSNAERLGAYLHAQTEFRGPNDPWWLRFRELLLETSAQLAEATSGTLLGAPLVSPTG